MNVPYVILFVSHPSTRVFGVQMGPSPRRAFEGITQGEPLSRKKNAQSSFFQTFTSALSCTTSTWTQISFTYRESTWIHFSFFVVLVFLPIKAVPTTTPFLGRPLGVFFSFIVFMGFFFIGFLGFVFMRRRCAISQGEPLRFVE